VKQILLQLRRVASIDSRDSSEFDRGLLTGLLIGDGSFGGDGRQPQIVLRMHVRHERILRWLQARFPATRLYGPYHHSGRHYYQWMARGQALVDEVLPLLDPDEMCALDDHAGERLRKMCATYAPFIAAQRHRSRLAAASGLRNADDPAAPEAGPGAADPRPDPARGA
jgi:hypothetical protein